VAIAFVDEHEVTSWTTTGLTKASTFTPNAGDFLVCFAGVADASITLTGISGGPTWTNRVTLVPAVKSGVYIWTAPVVATGSITVTLSCSSTGDVWGYNILRFTGVGSVGNSASINSATGTPSLGLTTTAANSVIVWASFDHNDVTTPVPTYLTATAGAFTEQSLVRQAVTIAVYGGFHANAGAAGAKTLGMSAPTGQDWTIGATEIVPAAGAVTRPVGMISQYGSYF
jgi:hypothetical protein